MDLIVEEQERKRICKEFHIPEKEKSDMYRGVREDGNPFYQMKPFHGKVYYQAEKDNITNVLTMEKFFLNKQIKKCQTFSSRSCLLEEKLEFWDEENQLIFQTEKEHAKKGIYFQGIHNELPVQWHLTSQIFHRIHVYEKKVKYENLEKCLRMMQLIDSEKFYTIHHTGKESLNGFFFNDSKMEQFQKEVIREYLPKEVSEVLKSNGIDMQSLLYFEGESIFVAIKQEDNIYLLETLKLEDLFSNKSSRMILKGDKLSRHSHRMTKSDILNIYQTIHLSERPMYQTICEYLNMIYESMRQNKTPIYFKVPDIWNQYLKEDAFSLDVLIFQIQNQLEVASQLEKTFEQDITCHSGKVKKII